MSTFSFPPILENTEDLIDLIAHAHTAAEATRCIALAACTLFLYDFITTIDDEVKYIWSKEWSVPRVVFHLNRVCPAIVIGVALPGMMIQHISPTSCKNIVLAYSYTSIMVSLNIAVVVVLRCWALYDRKPWVLKFLVSFLMLMILPCVYVVTKQANDNLYPIVTLPEILPGCIVVYSSYAWIPYTFALCFESMVFSMMLHRTYVITQKYGNTRLIWRLMIDGTLYYVAAIAAVIFCLGAAVSDSLRAPVISSGLLVSILSTMCSRMILSLHNFTEQEQLERLGTSGVAPAPVFSSSLKVATSDIYEERFKKLEYERSTDHERTSFKFDGGADDYSEIEMNVLRVSDRIGINV